MRRSHAVITISEHLKKTIVSLSLLWPGNLQSLQETLQKKQVVNINLCSSHKQFNKIIFEFIFLLFMLVGIKQLGVFQLGQVPQLLQCNSCESKRHLGLLIQQLKFQRAKLEKYSCLGLLQWLVIDSSMFEKRKQHQHQQLRYQLEEHQGKHGGSSHKHYQGKE